jgi:hypothetical protein
MRSLLFSALLVCAASPLANGAGLTWTRTSYAEKVTSAQQEVEVLYPFKNTSDHPISITGVNTSCGCTTAGRYQTRYAPGETGRIPVTFTVGQRKGPQDKEILVFTDEANARPYALQLHVDIQPLYTIESRSELSARGDDRVREYTFTVTAQTPAAIHVVSALSAVLLRTQIEEITPGRAYAVHLTPYSGDKKPLLRGSEPKPVYFVIDVAGVGRTTDSGAIYVR